MITIQSYSFFFEYSKAHWAKTVIFLSFSPDFCLKWAKSVRILPFSPD